MDQREWDYGARLPRDRRAAESWSLDNGPESTESGENPPKWQSITDTGSLEPSPEALAWAQRADQWAQQPNLPERQQPGQGDGQVSRWSEVVPTGNFPADGVGWRTETAEWRATSARWRQTTEWRSSSGTHGWRSTTEAWQTGDGNAEGFPPPGAPPTGGPLAISGSAWPGDGGDPPANAQESWQQAGGAPDSGPQTDGSYRTETYTPPGASGQQPSDDRPGWQQFTTPAPPWQQPAPAPPWQQPSGAASQQPAPGGAAWPQGAAWQQAAPSPPPWEQPRPWQQLVGPDDGRHLVREDDRQQWRQSAAGATAPPQNGQVGRRRAPEGGQPRAGGDTGWSARSESDNWAGHADTGSMPLFPEQMESAGWQDRAGTPSWRAESAAEAPDWRSGTEPASWQDPNLPSRPTPEQPPDWRSSSQRSAPDETPAWRSEGSPRGWRSDGRLDEEAPRAERRDAPDWRTDGRFPDGAPSGAPDWRGNGRPPDTAPSDGRRPADDSPGQRTERRALSDTPDWRGASRPIDDLPGQRTQRRAPGGGADRRPEDGTAPDWRTQTTSSSWREPAAEPDPSDWRSRREDTDVADWRSQTSTSSWEPPAGRDPGWEAESGTPGWRGNGRADAEAPDWRREPDSGSWSRGEEPRAEGWRRAPEPEAPTWRRDQEWRRDEPAADPWAQNAADSGVIPASWQPPTTDTGSWRPSEIEPPRRESRRPEPYAAGSYAADPYAAEPYSPAEPYDDSYPPRRPAPRREEPIARAEAETYSLTRRDERDPYGRRPEIERFDDPYGRRAEIEAGPRRRAQIESAPEDDWDDDEDDAPPPEAPISPEVWQPDSGQRAERANWRMEPLDDARTQSWRRELAPEPVEQGPLVGEAATEIRPAIDWQQAEREAAGRGSATYREGNTGDWRRDLAAESDLADGESRRYGTSDFVPFTPSVAGATAVPAPRPAPDGVARVDEADPATSGRWQDPPDTQWPPRPATSYQSANTGSYERRPVSTLPTASGRQNNLLEPDEDEIEETTGGPLAAVGYTVIWYGVPVVLFVLYMLVLNGSQQAHALSTLAGAAPQFGLSLVLSMLVAVGLRWASGSWKAASVGLAAAVMGGGLATVLTSAITGNSLS